MHLVDGIFHAEHLYRIPFTERLDDFKWYRFEPWIQAKLKFTTRSFLEALYRNQGAYGEGHDDDAFDLWFTWYDEYNATEGKEDYENWKKNNEQQELNHHTDDSNEEPSLY